MSSPVVPESLRPLLVRWWGRLLLMTVLIALAITTRYFDAAEFGSSVDAVLFRAAMLIGHFTTLLFVLLSPLLLLIVIRPRPRLIVPLGALWSSAILIGLLIDTQVYHLYRFHINAGVLNLLFGGAAAETFVFTGEAYVQAILIVAGVLATIAVAATLLWLEVRRSARRPRVARAFTAGALIAVAAFHMTHLWADATMYEPILEQTDVLPMRYAATAKRFLRDRGLTVVSRPSMLANGPERSRLSYPLEPLQCRTDEDRPNVVFIVIDSWRFDEMNALATPNLHAFSQRAVQFHDHRSGGNATRIGLFSLFYAVPGTYWHPMLAEQQGPVLIAELLRQQYDVQVFRSAPLYSPEFDRTVFADLPAPRMQSQGRNAAERDRDVTVDFKAFLAARSATAEPYFALLFYDATHSFEVPQGYPKVFRPSVPVNYMTLNATSERLPVLNHYRNSLHYVDSLIGDVLATMQARGQLENTVLVITGDHGQEFNDTGRNYWGHGSNFTRYQTGVPFILYAPVLEPRSVNHRTTHFDVAPTLLTQYLGCTGAPQAYSVGRSLFESGGREPLVLSEYMDFAVLSGDRIAVVRKHSTTVFDSNYERMTTPLDSEAVRAALEQKTRFYKKNAKSIKAAAATTARAGAE